MEIHFFISGLSSLGVPGVPWHTQAGQLTLLEPGGTDYGHLITTGIPGFSDLLTALHFTFIKINKVGTKEYTMQQDLNAGMQDNQSL